MIGELFSGPVKTRDGARDLPVLGLARAALASRLRQREADRANLGAA